MTPQELKLLTEFHLSSRLLPVLRHWRDSSEVASSYLIAGPEGIGSDVIARFLARFLSCTQNGVSKEPHQSSIFGSSISPGYSKSDTRPLAPCESCEACLHPSYVEIFPESTSSGREGKIKVDQLEVIHQKLGYAAEEGQFRIFVLHRADQMTPQAANSLLKVLEEPQRGWVFILTTTDRSLILPTLLSRSQTLTLSPLPDELLCGIADSEKAPILAKLSHGSIERLADWKEPNTWAFRGLFMDFLKNPVRNLNPLLDQSSKDDRHFGILLDLLESTSHDLLLLSTTHTEKQRVVNQDELPLLEQLLARYADTYNFLLDRLAGVAEAREHRGIPLNRKLAIQTLLLPWAGEAPT